VGLPSGYARAAEVAGRPGRSLLSFSSLLLLGLGRRASRPPCPPPRELVGPGQGTSRSRWGPGLGDGSVVLLLLATGPPPPPPPASSSRERTADGVRGRWRCGWDGGGGGCGREDARGRPAGGRMRAAGVVERRRRLRGRAGVAARSGDSGE